MKSFLAFLMLLSSAAAVSFSSGMYSASQVFPRCSLLPVNGNNSQNDDENNNENQENVHQKRKFGRRQWGLLALGNKPNSDKESKVEGQKNDDGYIPTEKEAWEEATAEARLRAATGKRAD
mmetsp:Transcript_18748/g.26935  ORF Transcript_18748/g.26935 Transcript_18748/m.26935 type:complete len:121 (-) Transcript_18748:371-733(-)|eukprot:CAMPEP_0202441306 /NCGR_PEP_ID=MMETSP1360-20130828/775_1 /ASSEMBLY_ACC=CAM_ASM_000848 /TAXON_ID=515479 /ORGANISM="Licmophora paradoxa, Strain CCMP2313" /LENGTH=120 /DNA_ID=CAMNT_0049056227 /DNA_START=65 /DNA_END=427 /DNA_ORIENTATION=-